MSDVSREAGKEPLAVIAEALGVAREHPSIALALESLRELGDAADEFVDAWLAAGDCEEWVDRAAGQMMSALGTTLALPPNEARS